MIPKNAQRLEKIMLHQQSRNAMTHSKKSRRALDAFHDADVAFRAVAERIKRGLVAGRVMRRGCRRDAVELDHDAALIQPCLIGLRRRAARKKFAARSLDRRARELGVS